MYNRIGRVTAVWWHVRGCVYLCSTADVCRSLHFAAFDKLSLSAEDTQSKAARFGTELASAVCNAWVHSIAWAPSGDTIAAALHNKTVHMWRPFVKGAQHPVAEVHHVCGNPLPSFLLSIVKQPP
jgi:WD40 repeat protein